ncbi:hypothetical protein [Streptomyces sp. ODS28]|uniref:hypothetical protein n=1 Tax=Streptomyces sp. ODS28 TaxID=3136688 RepID=UPI0031E94083
MSRRNIIIGVVAVLAVGMLWSTALKPVMLRHNENLPKWVNNELFHEEVTSYAKAGDAPHGEGDPTAVPGWVPGDATDVKVKGRTDKPGVRLMRFTLAGTPVKAEKWEKCRPGKVGSPIEPSLKASWGPLESDDARGRCAEKGNFWVLVTGERGYVWTNSSFPIE